MYLLLNTVWSETISCILCRSKNVKCAEIQITFLCIRELLLSLCINPCYICKYFHFFRLGCQRNIFEAWNKRNILLKTSTHFIFLIHPLTFSIWIDKSNNIYERRTFVIWWAGSRHSFCGQLWNSLWSSVSTQTIVDFDHLPWEKLCLQSSFKFQKIENKLNH